MDNDLPAPNPPATNNVEAYLAMLAGVEDLPMPATINNNVEYYLRYLVENGGGGGGTSDYPHLTNKPKINNVELNGNKTSSDLGLQPAGNYVTNTDYAGASKAGVIRTNPDYGTSITSAGALISATKTYQQYQDATTPNMFISKGTLENVITGKGLNQIVTLTQQEYDALTTKDPNTYYYIEES